MYQGVALSVTSTCLFAALYYYTILLQPLSAEEIFGFRILLTLPFITLFLLASKEWARVGETVARLRRRPQLLAGLTLSSALLGLQQWLFMWAPLNGAALQVSLGYFLLPLAMLLVGRLLFRERLTALQIAAAAMAAVGVVHAACRAGGFSWEALLVCLGYPAYFVLRRKLATNHLGGLWFDMLLALPVAAWLALRQPDTVTHFAQRPALYGLVIGLAMLSAAALISYIVASRRLPLSLFGLLGYVEPVLMILVAFLLGERIAADQWWTYIPIWMAVGMLVCDGLWYVLRRRRLA